MDYKQVADWQTIPCLSKLKDLSTPPKQLFISGKFEPSLFNNCVGIVGSRQMTGYGARVVEKIIPQLVSQGKTIVSGFMYGVDQYAHRLCAASGGKTIAVLGWGISKPLTGEDLKLANLITQNGGILLSEWDNQQATHWTFPSRNRIIAALSDEIIVVEAAQKSGSLITAKFASSLKRPLWAVPGPITSKTSQGTNSLISTGKAKVWLDYQPAPMTNTSDPIIALLQTEALSADELCLKLNLPIHELGSKLSILLLTGHVLEKNGKYYIK